MLIECARLFTALPEPPAVPLAVLDREELGKVGSRTVARDPEPVRDLGLVTCLESSSMIARALTAAGAVLRKPLPVLTTRDTRPEDVLSLLATGLFRRLMNLDRSDHAPFWNRGGRALDYPRLTALTTVVAAAPRQPRILGDGDH